VAGAGIITPVEFAYEELDKLARAWRGLNATERDHRIADILRQKRERGELSLYPELPAWDDAIKLGRHPLHLTEAEWNARKKQIRVKMQNSPLPAEVQGAAALINALDDVQDVTATVSLIGRLLIRAAPRVLGRFVPVVGWIATASDVLNLLTVLASGVSVLAGIRAEGAAGAVAGAVGPVATKLLLKAKLWHMLRNSRGRRPIPNATVIQLQRIFRKDFKLDPKIARAHAKFIGRPISWRSFIEPAQALESFTGYGLSLGAFMGYLSEWSWALGRDVVAKVARPYNVTIDLITRQAPQEFFLVEPNDELSWFDFTLTRGDGPAAAFWRRRHQADLPLWANIDGATDTTTTGAGGTAPITVNPFKGLPGQIALAKRTQHDPPDFEPHVIRQAYFCRPRGYTLTTADYNNLVGPLEPIPGDGYQAHGDEILGDGPEYDCNQPPGGPPTPPAPGAPPPIARPAGRLWCYHAKYIQHPRYPRVPDSLVQYATANIDPGSTYVAGVRAELAAVELILTAQPTINGRCAAAEPYAGADDQDLGRVLAALRQRPRKQVRRQIARRTQAVLREQQRVIDRQYREERHKAEKLLAEQKRFDREADARVRREARAELARAKRELRAAARARAQAIREHRDTPAELPAELDHLFRQMGADRAHDALVRATQTGLPSASPPPGPHGVPPPTTLLQPPSPGLTTGSPTTSRAPVTDLDLCAWLRAFNLDPPDELVITCRDLSLYAQRRSPWRSVGWDAPDHYLGFDRDGVRWLADGAARSLRLLPRLALAGDYLPRELELAHLMTALHSLRLLADLGIADTAQRLLPFAHHAHGRFHPNVPADLPCPHPAPCPYAACGLPLPELSGARTAALPELVTRSAELVGPVLDRRMATWSQDPTDELRATLYAQLAEEAWSLATGDPEPFRYEWPPPLKLLLSLAHFNVWPPPDASPHQLEAFLDLGSQAQAEADPHLVTLDILRQIARSVGLTLHPGRVTH
jgi:hypothetical protein